jgi:hypothetical protein
MPLGLSKRTRKEWNWMDLLACDDDISIVGENRHYIEKQMFC